MDVVDDYEDWSVDDDDRETDFDYSYDIGDPSVAEWSKGILLPQALAQERAAKTKAFEAYDLENPETFKHIKADYRSPRDAKWTDALLGYISSQEEEEKYSGIHDVHVVGSRYLGNWTYLAIILAKAENLAEVVWEANQFITSEVSNTLDSRMKPTRLIHKSPVQEWDSYAPDFHPVGIVGVERHHLDKASSRESILGSKSLHTLETKITYGSATNLEDATLLTKILFTSPNLRILDLAFNHEGCVFHGTTPYAFNFTIAGQFPPLETLKLYRYALEAFPDGTSPSYKSRVDHARRHLRWPWKMLPNVLTENTLVQRVDSWDGIIFYHNNKGPGNSSQNNIELWLQRMEWSHLHTLQLTGSYSNSPETYKRLAASLPALRDLTLEGPNSEAQVAFLNALPNRGLESIDFEDVDAAPLDPLIDAIRIHKNTLKKLKLCYHGQGRSSRYRTKQSYIPIKFSYLPRLYSSERYLSFNGNDSAEFTCPEGQWDDTAIRVLASIKNIARIRLNILPEITPKNPTKLDAIHKLLGELERFINWQQPYDSQNLDPENDHFKPVPTSLGKSEVEELWAMLSERKVGERLEELWLFFGPWEDDGKLWTNVWRCGKERGCEGRLYATTKAWEKDRRKEKAWSQVLSEWAVRRKALL